MQRSLAIFGTLLFLSFFLCCGAVALVFHITPDHRRGGAWKWLAVWFTRGVLLPALFWSVINIGLSFWLQPFMPDIQAARNAGAPWFPEYLRITSEGWFVLVSYWGAATLIWKLVDAFQTLQGEPRLDFRSLAAMSFVGLMLPGIGLIYFGGWECTGLAVMLMAAPIAGYAPEILRMRLPPPMYARAIAKVKFGKYNDAEMAIISELEKKEDDFEGWMMLADLYATKFGDVAEAEQTILEICDQPRTSPSQLSIALHRLADWHLRHHEDPDAARRALHVIIARLPGSHLARMAQLRIDTLPDSAESLREQKSPPVLLLPALGDRLDEDDVPLDPAEANRIANDCVEKLQRNPNNVAAREKLARILAEQLGNPAVGIEQLSLLLNMEDQPEMRRADWLATIAAWTLKYLSDEERARILLERVVSEFPTSPHALAARRRLTLLQPNTPG
jgi:hypothetical protein